MAQALPFLISTSSTVGGNHDWIPHLPFPPPPFPFPAASPSSFESMLCLNWCLGLWRRNCHANKILQVARLQSNASGGGTEGDAILLNFCGSPGPFIRAAKWAFYSLKLAPPWRQPPEAALDVCRAKPMFLFELRISLTNNASKFPGNFEP